MASETTAILIDGRDARRIIPQAWPVAALRPYLFRWCATCGQPDCGYVGHPIFTFTAAQQTPQGWEYRTTEIWPVARRARTTVAVIINDRGDVMGHATGVSPWPPELDWQGQPCALWCQDVRGQVVYRLKDA